MQPSASDDERLAQIVSDLTDRIRRGESPNLQAFLQQHPDLETELKQVWPALVLAEELAMPPPDRRSRIEDRGSKIEIHPVQSSILDPRSSISPLPRTFGDYELLEEIGRGG